ncbi:MAG TPA: hypothetical protein DF383_00925, partial [Deltaproteobacteria bacterium]|nr:hypothetical protein [Deltaproteobacteria bacterium]
MKAKVEFNISKWDEKPYKQISEEMKLTKASVVLEFKGQVEGQAIVEWLMFYKHSDVSNPLKSSAIYVGL